jgi:4,5-dihydroxyphthalate decarboxylase
LSQLLDVSYCGHLSDRVDDLYTGRVTPSGVNLRFIRHQPAQAFRRMLAGEFTTGEMSLATHIVRVSRGEQDLVGIPVFPSRVFRHRAIYVRRSAGLSSPADLVGRRVGVPEYQMTAALWVRGLLRHEYGVLPEQIEWVTGGLQQAGRRGLVDIDVPGVKVSHETGASLDALLVRGEIDAIVAPQAPPSYGDPDGDVTRLFSDDDDVEMAYYAKHRLFPIMHTVVIRRDVLEQQPWLAASLYDAFCRAKDNALGRLLDIEPLGVSLPFLDRHLHRTVETMGRDFWPYGVERNLPELRTACGYAFEQGLTSRLVDPLELFSPHTTDGMTSAL